MRLHQLFTIAAVSMSFMTGSAIAQDDKANKQAEIRKVTQASLEKFYKVEPKIKGEVSKAPGYAVFTTYGLSFLIGGAGGKGLVHDRSTKKDVFMEMAQANIGAQVGASESETLIVFETTKGMNEFIAKGWEFGGGGGIGAGAAGKTAGGQSGGNAIPKAKYYTLTKNGLQIGGAVAGTKFWKDDTLN